MIILFAFYHIDHEIIRAKFLHHLSADTTGIGIFHGILSLDSTGNGDSGKLPLSFTDSLEKGSVNYNTKPLFFNGKNSFLPKEEKTAARKRKSRTRSDPLRG